MASSIAPPMSVIMPKDLTAVAQTQNTPISYHNDPLSELSKTDDLVAAWSIHIPIEPPVDILSPTLHSITYTITYNTKVDTGNSTLQTDIIRSSQKLALGVTKAGSDTRGLYRPRQGDRAPRVPDERTSNSILTVSLIKYRSDCIDSRDIYPDIRLDGPRSRLYLVFNVDESPTKDMERLLSVQGTARWTHHEMANKEGEGANIMNLKDRRPLEEIVSAGGQGVERGQADKRGRAERYNRTRTLAADFGKGLKDIRAESDKRVAAYEVELQAGFDKRVESIKADYDKRAANFERELKAASDKRVAMIEEDLSARAATDKRELQASFKVRIERANGEASKHAVELQESFDKRLEEITADFEKDIAAASTAGNRSFWEGLKGYAEGVLDANGDAGGGLLLNGSSNA